MRFPDGYDAIDPTANVEKFVSDKMLVDQLIANHSLTDEERKFIEILYKNPGSTFQELADIMGLKHRESARRMLVKIRKKLIKYQDAQL